jgi:hypothetical protein
MKIATCNINNVNRRLPNLEDAELPVQRRQRRLAPRVSELLRWSEPTGIRKGEEISQDFEKALAIHVADRDRLSKRLADAG